MPVSAWLLESKGGWYFGRDLKSVNPWTRDPNEAVRFAREVDAQQCLVWLSAFGVLTGPKSKWTPIEHGWVTDETWDRAKANV